MSKDTGGPAFPREDYQCNGDASGRNGLGQEGMSLRDWLAGMAMQGWLSSYGKGSLHPSASGHESTVANNAYKLADAMIAARSR